MTSRQQTTALAIAVYGVVAAVAFILLNAATGVAVLVVGAVLLSFVFRAARPKPGEGRDRARNRNRRAA